MSNRSKLFGYSETPPPDGWEEYPAGWVSKKQISSQRQYEQFCAEHRTNIKLLRRAKDYSKQLEEQIQQAVHFYLEYNTRLYHRELIIRGIRPGMTREERKEALCPSDRPYELSFYEESFKRKAAITSDQCRRAEWHFRIGQAIAYYESQPGWYVYFITLTVDPQRYDGRKLFSDSIALSRYLRTLAYRCARANGDKTPKGQVRIKDWVRYCANLEHGSTQRHHHLHCIVCLKNPPEEWLIDPNRGIRSKEARRHTKIPSLTTDWKYSQAQFSEGGPFRTFGDKWKRIRGHVWPVKQTKKAQKNKSAEYGALPCLAPEVSGGYISKYISKSEKLWDHRMKSTQGFGFERLDKYLMQQTPETLTKLSQRPVSYGQLVNLGTIVGCPASLMRKRAKFLLNRINYQTGYLDHEENIKPSDYSWSDIMNEFYAQKVPPHRMEAKQLWETINAALPEGNFSEEQIKQAYSSMKEDVPKIQFKQTKALGGI